MPSLNSGCKAEHALRIAWIAVTQDLTPPELDRLQCSLSLFDGNGPLVHSRNDVKHNAR